jgi:hypothetical protein
VSSAPVSTGRLKTLHSFFAAPPRGPPLPDRPWAGARGRLVAEWPQRGQPEHAVQRGTERQGVDRIAGGDAPLPDDQAAERRTHQHRELEAEVGQRDPGRHLVRRQQPDRERPAGWGTQCGAGRLQRHQAEQHPPRSDPGERLAGQQAGDHYLPKRRDQHQFPAVDRIGQRTADQAEHHHRNRFGEHDRADADRAAGELPGLVQHGDGGQLAAESGQVAADPQPAEGGV